MRSFRIGSVMGIPIRINITLLIFLPVIAWIIGSDVSTDQGAELWVSIIEAISPHSIELSAIQEGNIPWIIGGSAAIGLFVGVTIHELGHSWVARRYGLTISSITLWIFGGMARMEENPKEWNIEFWMALAGPVTSVLVGAVCFLILQAVPGDIPVLVFIFGWLTVMNIGLAVFNMLPAFPMDGGRVLRAVLSRGRSYEKATKTAAEIGKFLALIMGFFGILLLSPILVLIALFVYVAASSESRMTVVSEALEGVKVSDLMTTDVKTVSPDTSINELTTRMLQERHTGYPVVDSSGNVSGIVTLSDARGIREVERDAIRVEDAMTREVISVKPEDDAFEVLKTLNENDMGRVIVKEDGDMVGIISRTDLLTALEVLQGGGELRSKSLPNV